MNATTHPPGLYTAPPLTSEDEAVLGEIHRLRRELRFVLRTPRRWEGGLRRSALARNIRGSNSILEHRRMARGQHRGLLQRARAHCYRVRRGGYAKRAGITDHWLRLCRACLVYRGTSAEGAAVWRPSGRATYRGGR